MNEIVDTRLSYNTDRAARCRPGKPRLSTIIIMLQVPYVYTMISSSKVNTKISLLTCGTTENRD